MLVSIIIAAFGFKLLTTEWGEKQVPPVLACEIQMELLPIIKFNSRLSLTPHLLLVAACQFCFEDIHGSQERVRQTECRTNEQR